MSGFYSRVVDICISSIRHSQVKKPVKISQILEEVEWGFHHEINQSRVRRPEYDVIDQSKCI